jgi:hypothetical protein
MMTELELNSLSERAGAIVTRDLTIKMPPPCERCGKKLLSYEKQWMDKLWLCVGCKATSFMSGEAKWHDG